MKKEPGPNDSDLVAGATGDSAAGGAEKRPKYQFKYDPDRESSTGNWKCPVCGFSFAWGGEAVHKPDCAVKDQGYDSCEYYFGPKEVEKLLEYGRTPPNSPPGFTLEMLQQQFPELVPREKPNSSS